MPVDFLKIDGDFVRGPRSTTDQLVVSSIVNIARGLGKQTIAEFVEDAETLEHLRGTASTTPRASTSAARRPSPSWPREERSGSGGGGRGLVGCALFGGDEDRALPGGVGLLAVVEDVHALRLLVVGGA